ncbi:MAG: energy transducer TonB [Bacteroidota bacterium]
MKYLVFVCLVFIQFVSFGQDNKESITHIDTLAIIDQMPLFLGGDAKLYKYLDKNLKYPIEAKKNKISGKVFVSFVIKEDGSVSRIKVLRGIGFGCDEEAIRLVQSMPKWTPGQLNGKPVRVSFNLPINFKL